jgi:gluconolactonase
MPAGGTSAGGGAGQAGAASGGASGAAGQAGAGGAAVGYTCPAGPFATNPIPSGATPTRIAGAPPADTFNNDGNNFTNVEGPVWIGDSLYFSEMTNANTIPPARILRIGPSDAVSVFKTDSGSNGLAVDNAGNLVSANHGAQGIVQFTVPAGAATTLVSMYMSKKFNSPNDLTVRSDGTIYFTDPNYQNTANPQNATRVYRLVKGSSTADIVASDYTNQPNGITLSLDEKTLFVGGGSGLKAYTIDASGNVGATGTAFGPSEVATANTDGMGIDCAGNLYVAVASSTNVVVVSSTGAKVGQISVSGVGAVTNVAFGGTDHKTLYITGQGAGKAQGVFKVTLAIPGKPY